MSAQIVSTATMLSIGLVGCAAPDQADDFGPPGHHLRWFYPAANGYPAGGADIWHLGESEWKQLALKAMRRCDLTDPVSWTASTNWSGRDRHYPVHSDAVIITRADATWKATLKGLEAADRGDGENFVVHFNQPVVAVRLETRRAPASRRRSAASPTNVSVRHGARELDLVPLVDGMSIEHPGITDLIVPNVIDTIIGVSFLTEVAAAEVVERSGRRLVHLDLPQDVGAAYDLTTVAAGLKNRMFAGSTIEELKKAYRPKAVSQLVEHLHDTVGAPGHAVTTPSGPDLTSSEVSVLDHLRLASVDPVVARMLASYWVDPKPEPGIYMLRADYDTPDKLLGFGLAFTAHGTDAPKLKSAVARQLPGIEYRQRRPHARVGLTFNGLEQSSSVERTVMVDVRRHMPRDHKLLTDQRPHLVNAASKSGFTDDGLPVPESYKYEVTPIDIFGRLGASVTSEAVSLVDLSRPTPPKHLHAAVAQHGAPWLDPSARSDFDRTATLDAGAEFAEAQLTVAPDAQQITWCWRSNPSDRDPSSWHVLDTSKVVPPKIVEVTWKAGEPLAAYPLAVAVARPVDDTTMSDRLDRLDAVTRSAVDSIAAVPELVEVLLDTALYEPNVFRAHIVEVDNSLVEVVDSTAGIARSDDTTEGQKMTARLLLPRTQRTLKIAPGDVLSVRHEAGTAWSPNDGTPPPLMHVPLPPGDDHDDRAEGGEVAIDFPYVVAGSTIKPVDHDNLDKSRIDSTIVGRVVSDHRSTGQRSVLLRVRPDDADRLLQIERIGDDRRMLARHHRPYVMPRQTLGVDGGRGTLQIDLAPEQRFTAIWLSAFTTDGGGFESTQVATPAEVRIVRPPPTGRPSPPFPEADGTNATVGELSPPDVEGVATAQLAWAPIDAGSVGDHVRYEVGRALASTVVAAERDRWFRGAPLAIAVGIVAGASAGTTTNGVVKNPQNGTVRIGIEAVTTAGFDAAAFAGGRLRLGTGNAVSFHRLLRVAAAAGGGLELLIRPVVSIIDSDLLTTPVNTVCALEAAPSYEAVLADDELIRQLADLPGTDGRSDDTNEGAFGLVTGTPVVGQRFIDRLPGIGRSRFFYKVRAVYPGESRSPWSATSVGFHQVDTTAAESILDVRTVRSAAGESIVSFRLPPDPLVVGVRITSLAADGAVLGERDEYVSGGSGQHGLTPSRITSSGGILDLQAHVGRTALERHNGAATNDPRVLRLFPADVDQAAPTADDLLPAGDLGRSVVIGREHDGAPLVFVVRQPDGTTEWVTSVSDRHEVEVVPTADVVTVSIATLKFVTVAGTAHAFHSAPTLLPAPSPLQVDGDDDASD